MIEELISVIVIATMTETARLVATIGTTNTRSTTTIMIAMIGGEEELLATGF